ncbi:MAG: hypothetical protein J5747_00520 [Spirochaetaceae bacterium]|nr:hypothetical protein [Spirochaetaceae bacterium]
MGINIRELITWLGFQVDEAAFVKYDRKVESAKKKAAGLSSAISGIGKVAKLIGGAAAVAGITALGKSILDTTGEVEQYRVTLGTMIGDQEKANAIISNLDYSPVSDFYGTAAAIGGLQGMVTFGMQAEDASETLTRLGDIAQGNGEAFKSLSLNMGQVFAKGKADATDLKQFVGQGFDVVGEISKMTGKSRAEIEKAGVSYEQCAAALKHITSEGGKYNGMLEKQSRTIPGLIKQFQSLSAAIKESIGLAVLDRVKELMQYFLKLGKSIQDNIVSVGTKAFEVLLDAIADVIIVVNLIKMEMEEFGGALTPVKALAEDVFGFLGSVINDCLPLIKNVAKAILLAFKPIQAFLHPVIEALKPLFKDVFGFAADQVNALLPIIESLTPKFAKVGEIIAGLIKKLSPILRNIRDAIMAAFKPIQAFIMPVLDALMSAAETVFGAFSGLLDDTADATSGLAGIIESLTPIMSFLGELIGGIITVLANGLEAVMPVLKPIAGIVLGIVAAIKIWTAAQTVLNAVMNANPIGLIILAVVALIGVIATLVKNWDKVKNGLINGAKAVGDFFKKIWEAIKNAFKVAFDAIKNVMQRVFDGIKIVWSGIVDFFTSLIEGVKSVWEKIKGFFSGLWNGIISVAQNIWDGITGVFSAVIDKIKAVWNGITGFFSGLWESLKETVSGVADAIKNTFLGLFDSIKQKFFGFIDTIKEGWNKVKGFFTGLWDGVVDFVTGGSGKEEPTKVNDMILTPDGTYSTHPDDTIFAMKNPGSLVDRLAEFFAQSANPSSYALAGDAAANTVRQSVSNDYSRHSSSSVFNTPIHVTVNAGGLSTEQARRAVESGVKSALRDAIAGSRGTISVAEAGVA